jgi:hypothetical protein
MVKVFDLCIRTASRQITFLFLEQASDWIINFKMKSAYLLAILIRETQHFPPNYLIALCRVSPCSTRPTWLWISFYLPTYDCQCQLFAIFAVHLDATSSNKSGYLLTAPLGNTCSVPE